MMVRRGIVVGLLVQLTLPLLWAQAARNPLSDAAIKAAAGSEAAAPGPLAADLTAGLTHGEVRRAVRKVADWQLAEAKGKFNQDWTYAPLYLGLLATSPTTQDAKYRDAVMGLAEGFQWKLWAYRDFHADDEAIAQAYEQLYAGKPDAVRIADARATFDRVVARPDDPAKDLWWWCDALFMAPAGMARMAAITGDRRYVEKMDAEWRLTAEHLTTVRSACSSATAATSARAKRTERRSSGDGATAGCWRAR